MINSDNPDQSGADFVVPNQGPDQTPITDTKEQKVSAEGTHYLNYWKEMRDDWRVDDPARAHLAHAKFMRIPQLRNVIRSGELAPGSDTRRETVLTQASEWLHILGPENPLNGAADDLEKAAALILEHLDDAPNKAGAKQGYQMDAASALIAASRVVDDPAKKQELRIGAHGVLDQVKSLASTEAGLEIKKHAADAAMLKQELDYDELFDAYFNSEGYDGSPSTPEDFQIEYARFHMRHVREFLGLMGGRSTDSVLPTGVAFEWWHSLMHRHHRLTTSSQVDLPHERLRTSLSFEDAPHEPFNTSRDTLSDAKDATVERYDDDGRAEVIGRIQIKSFDDMDRKYRKPIIVLAVKDGDLQTNQKMNALMRITTRGMIAKFEGREDQVPHDDMARSLELTDWHNYEESTLVSTRKK